MSCSDFDRDGQPTLALNLIIRHAHAIPLLWLTSDMDGTQTHSEPQIYDVTKSRLDGIPTAASFGPQASTMAKTLTNSNSSVVAGFRVGNIWMIENLQKGVPHNCWVFSAENSALAHRNASVLIYSINRCRAEIKPYSQW